MRAGCHDDIRGWSGSSALETNSVLLKGSAHPDAPFSHPALLLRVTVSKYQILDLRKHHPWLLSRNLQHLEKKSLPCYLFLLDPVHIIIHPSLSYITRASDHLPLSRRAELDLTRAERVKHGWMRLNCIKEIAERFSAKAPASLQQHVCGHRTPESPWDRQFHLFAKSAPMFDNAASPTTCRDFMEKETHFQRAFNTGH